MREFTIHFPEINYRFPMILVQGTGDALYEFGATEKIKVRIRDFYISRFPVTQLVWEQVMGSNPSYFKEAQRPVENVSHADISTGKGFLHKLNSFYHNNHPSRPDVQFRLPTETEWEYAARGGIYWKDNFLFSGSNDITQVGWQSEIKSGTHTHPVGKKLPNQLGIHDMCGNVWEWCEDYFQSNVQLIPSDGTAFLVRTNERVLRGGCHHNMAIHCTVSKRYAITPDAKDECIGFRIAVGADIHHQLV